MQILDTNSRTLSVSNAFYKRLISIYPASFKLSFRNELQQVFDNKTRSVFQKSGWIGVFAFWMRTLFDTIQTAIHEHIEELFQMKLNPKKTTINIFALIAGLLTVLIVSSSWAEFPYPFPTKLTLYGRYLTYNSVDEDNAKFYDYIEERTEHNQGIFGPPGIYTGLPDSIYEDVLGEAPNIPRGQKPSLGQGVYSYFDPNNNQGETYLFSAHFQPSSWSWGPDMVVGQISLWENHASPFVILLPSLWFGVLTALMLWTNSNKMGTFGLSLGIVGILTMLFSLEELFRDLNIFGTSSEYTLWQFFTFGILLMGIGLAFYGIEVIKNKGFSIWNFLPILMGVSQIGLEIISRFYLTNDLMYWPRVQGVILIIFSLCWIPFTYHFFNFKKPELSPA